jgi:hypothetical protein
MNRSGNKFALLSGIAVYALRFEFLDVNTWLEEGILLS